MSRYLRVCSDLHLEFRVRRELGYPSLEVAIDNILPADGRDKDSTIVLAGDIHTSWPALLEVFKILSKRFIRVMHVAGNHEFYGHDIIDWKEFADKAIDIVPNLVIAYQNSITVTTAKLHKEPILLGTTLWTQGGRNPLEEMNGDRMSDFHVIKYKGNQFSQSHMRELHKLQLGILREELNSNHLLSTVVVTHHLPSFNLCDPRYGGDLDAFFASNCDDLMSGYNAPKIWVCGHTHRHIEQQCGRTLVVANPLGYPGEGKTNGYKSNFFLDLNNFSYAEDNSLRQDATSS